MYRIILRKYTIPKGRATHTAGPWRASYGGDAISHYASCKENGNDMIRIIACLYCNDCQNYVYLHHRFSIVSFNFHYSCSKNFTSLLRPILCHSGARAV